MLLNVSPHWMHSHDNWNLKAQKFSCMTWRVLRKGSNTANVVKQLLFHEGNRGSCIHILFNSDSYVWRSWGHPLGWRERHKKLPSKDGKPPVGSLTSSCFGSCVPESFPPYSLIDPYLYTVLGPGSLRALGERETWTLHVCAGDSEHLTEWLN